MEPEAQASELVLPTGEQIPLPSARDAVRKVNNVLRVVRTEDDGQTSAQRLVQTAGVEIMAHWYYQPEEWKRFIVAERARAVEQTKTRALLFGGPYLLLIALTVIMGVTSADTSVQFLVTAIFCTAVPASLLVGSMFAWDYYSKVMWCDELRAVPPEVLITRCEVIYGGPDYYKTRMNKPIKALVSGLRLWVQRVGEPILWFEITHFLFHRYREQVRVPIPAGREEDAEALAKSFDRRTRQIGGTY